MTGFMRKAPPERVLTFHMGLNHPINAVELIFGGVNVVVCLYHEKQQTQHQPGEPQSKVALSFEKTYELPACHDCRSIEKHLTEISKIYKIRNYEKGNEELWNYRYRFSRFNLRIL